MDYGGHDSVFEDNLVMAFGGKACIGFGSFKPGHGDVVRNNTCLVGLETISSSGREDFLPAATTIHSLFVNSTGQILTKEPDNVAMIVRCKDSNAVIHNNSYYTPHGNASYQCWNLQQEISLAELQVKYGLELGSTTERLPPIDVLVQWARALLIEDTLVRTS